MLLLLKYYSFHLCGQWHYLDLWHDYICIQFEETLWISIRKRRVRIKDSLTLVERKKNPQKQTNKTSLNSQRLGIICNLIKNKREKKPMKIYKKANPCSPQK